MPQQSQYSNQFYDTYRKGMLNSSRDVLGVLGQLYRPESVVDVGCGQGVWLRSAKELWSATVNGFDGAWVDTTRLADPSIQFVPVDLENDLELIEGSYDLCISMEVAEHLAPETADQFVATLCRLSPVVLFSAAIPFQGGTDHINEQWPSYWSRKFKRNKFQVLDIVRNQVWNNKNVKWWYRQNTILYIREGHWLLESEALKQAKSLHQNTTIDLVHPSHFIKKMNRSD